MPGTLHRWLAQLATILVVPVVCVASETASDVEANLIRETETRRLQALVDADVTAARIYHAADFHLISPGGMEFTRDSYMEAVGTGQLDYLVFEAESPLDVRLFGDGAVIRYKSVMQIAWEGKEGQPFRCWHTDLYEKREGRWQIVWSQVTGYASVEPEPAEPSADGTPAETPASAES